MKPLLTLIVLFLMVGEKVFGQADSLRIENHYYYLSDLDSREIAQRIMKDELLPSDNYITFRILDSLSSPIKEVRDFYHPVFDKILLMSDGALSEVMGDPIISYLRKYPDEFSLYFENDNEELFDKYSDYLAYELSFTDDYKKEIEKLKTEALSGCSKCNKELIENFLMIVSKKVGEI